MSTRVSSVLDYFSEPYLVKWKLKTKDWEKVSQDSLRVGSEVDRLVQEDINGGVGIYQDPQTVNCMNAWFKFRAERPDVFERLVKYRHNMQKELILGDLTGHPDFLLDDEREVVDLKTSKSIGKSHWMQTSEYGHMAYGMAKRISILRLDKLTGEYEYKTLEEPFISFWQRKFQARYEAFCEDKEFATMMQAKLEEEKLG